MDKRCKTCKWWRYIGYPNRPPGDCDLTRTDDFVRLHPASLAVSDYDGESGCGALMTFPDFGCVQWEAQGE